MREFLITRHAIERFHERVRPLPAMRSEELIHCLRAAKPKHLRRLRNGHKRTLIVPTGCCFFICSKGRVVSVVKQMRDAG